MEQPRLVICDIDGTLITDERILTPHAHDIITRLHNHNVYFGIASGRSVDQQLIKEAENWGFPFQFDVLIGMNGSELWDNLQQERHDFYKLKREWIKEIIELMEPFHLNPFIYYHDIMLCLRDDASTRRSSVKNKTDFHVVSDASELYAEENAKIMFRMPEELMPEAEAYVEKHPSPYYKAFKTQTTMLEFADKRVNKSVALLQFCKSNQIPLSQVMAFGDMTNDDELLQVSGMGVCLANGGKDTKAIADAITEYGNNEDGFARYMEEHVMKQYHW